MEAYRQISALFWNSDIWLPANLTWSDIAPNSHPEIKHADSGDLIFYPLPIALFLFLLRRTLEKGPFASIGIYLGVNPDKKARKAEDNEVLQKAFTSSKRPSNKTVKGLAKQLDWSDMKVERWFRQRRLQDKPSTLVKFAESMWRFCYYGYSFVFGCVVLWDKAWFSDIQACWRNYPHQSVDDGIWWYYMISLGFYWSLCFTQFMDVKRCDFWQMFGHHIATIALMSFSWVCNMTRIGSLVLIVHDCADILLELAKCAKFAGYQRMCDGLFAVFVPLWLATRCGLYPFWIIKNTLVDAVNYVPMFPAYYIFNGLLLSLLMLHIFWTYLMFQLIKNSLVVGYMPRDVRSGSEDESD